MRPGIALAVVAVLAAVPAALALGSTHLSGAPALLVVSTTTGALAVGVLAAQPWLAPRRSPRGRRRPLHVVLGGVVTALVAVHVGALVVDDPDDAWFAMSPDGPTRARMALIATVLLVAVTLLGLLRRRLRWSRATWRLVHGVLATLVVGLGVGHAVLTDGALNGAGTPLLVVLGAVGVVGALVGLAAGLRRPSG